MVDHVDYQQIIADAVDVFHNGFACSESVIYSLRKNFGWDELSDDAIAMSTGFPWGLGVRAACVVLWPAALCAWAMFLAGGHQETPVLRVVRSSLGNLPVPCSGRSAPPAVAS